MTTGEEHRADTSELVLYISGKQPVILLRLRLARRCRRWERQGYQLERRFQGTAIDLFDQQTVRSYDADRPDVRTVGVVLARPTPST